MSGPDPRPQSAERLRFARIDRAEVVSVDHVEVTVTVMYDVWCCGDGHEVADAVAAVTRVIAEGAETAKVSRLTGVGDGDA